MRIPQKVYQAINRDELYNVLTFELYETRHVLRKHNSTKHRFESVNVQLSDPIKFSRNMPKETDTLSYFMLNYSRMYCELYHENICSLYFFFFFLFEYFP